MEKLEIRILPQAAMKLSQQAEWYFNKCGNSFSITLIKNTVSDIEAIASMPTIGRNIPTRGKREYRVFISHKKCLIKYWYSPRTLYVVDIVFTDTHSPRFF